MFQRFIVPVADVGGGIKPASGAQLFFYEPGTSTFKDTFTDVNGIFPSTNPVIADSRGVFPSIFLTGTYKVVLKDKNNSQIWSEPAVQYDYSFDSASEAALAEFTADGQFVIVEFEADGEAAIDNFTADGQVAIVEFTVDGETAIDDFNFNSQEDITKAIDSVLQSIDGVVEEGVNQDFGFITQPVDEIIDYGSLTG